MDLAVKFLSGSDNIVQGLGIPFGGPNNGRDLEGEFFTPRTDLALDWFQERPLLYHHGLDGSLQAVPVGKIKSHSVDNVGVWVQGELDKSSKYFEAIKRLIGEGKLFFSSGAMSHLVKIKSSGEIVRWPWVEQSLTPIPANPMAQVSLKTAEKHFKAVGINFALKADPPMPGGPSQDAPQGPPKGAPQGPPQPDQQQDSGPIDLAGSYEVLIANLNAAVNPQGASDQQAGAPPPPDPSAQQGDPNQPGGGPSTDPSMDAQAGDQAPPTPAGATDEAPANLVLATFPGFCIVQEGAVQSDGTGSLWKVDYTVDDQGNVSLGDATPLDPDDIGMGQQDQEAPPASSADVIAKFARTFMESTKGLHERRTREGRELSARNRSAMARTAKTLRSTADALEGLLGSTSPSAEAGSVDRTMMSLELLKLKESLK